MTNQRKLLAVLAVLLLVAVVTPYTGPFLTLLVTRALVFAILAMSLDILLGFTG
jgi:ABC-type branched-subunit amino acid transport system permease subunit